ncbi:MAG TPA: polysaccharide deacetylase family protein [Gaiellaceae bacterium]|jgi:peptidoglycan/xylan/chitin deacetylase (PgdA/CDA1 family)
MRPVSAAFGVGALAAWCGPAAAPVVPILGRLFHIPLRLPGTRGIAITFDDGPHPEGTPAVLELLETAGVRATFYLVGEQVERRPSLAAEIAAAGHEIGIHGYRHTLLLRRGPGAIRDDLDRAAAIIGEATGRKSLSYRPPYGVFSLAGLQIARERWSPLLWTRWGRDWERKATPESIVRLATRDLGARDVVLLHDADFYSVEGSWRRTVAALPRVLDQALATGEPLVAASQST